MTYKNSLKQLGLFSFLGLAILISSCKKPEDGIGQNLLPAEDELFAFGNDETYLQATTVEYPLGRVRTDVYTNVMIGNYMDDVFGRVRTSAVIQFDLSSEQPVFPTTFDVEAVELNLVYLGRDYGTENDQVLKVNELGEVLNFDSAYYNTTEVALLNDVNLISPGFETVNTQSELAGVNAAGSLKSLKIRLRPEFGEFLLSADSVQRTSLAHFTNYFKGLRINSTTIDAQVINYDLSNTQTRLTVFYSDGDDTRKRYDFIVSDSCKHFTQVDHIYDNTPLESLSSLQELEGSVRLYTQSAGSAVVKVNMDLAWLRESELTTINQAMLVMPFDTLGTLEPIAAYSVSYYGDDGALHVLSTNNTAIFTLLREDVGYYLLNLTEFLQDYSEGLHNVTEIYLIPQSITFNVNRTVLNGPQFSPTDNSQNLRLNVVFTK